MAVNVTGSPLATDGADGVMLMPVSAAMDKLVAGEVMPLNVAVIDVLPVAATPVATPIALIVATPVLEEAQVAWLVTSTVVASVYVPVAVRLTVCPCTT